MMLPKRTPGGPEWVLQSTSLANSKAGAVSCASARSPPAPCLPVSLCLWPAPPGRKKKRGFLHSLEKMLTGQEEEQVQSGLP